MIEAVPFYLAITVFAVTYIAIVTNKISHTVCALAGSGIMIYLGIVSQSAAVQHYVDFNTLGMLAGMMILISIVRKSGCFEALALWSVKASRGEAKKLLLLLSLITGVGAALIDSVTSALLIAPMTLSICRLLKLNPMPFLFAEILMSNIGGTALMIGNPPNVMIGSASHLDFMDFMFNLAPVVFATTAVILFFVILIYRKSLTSRELDESELSNIVIKNAIQDMGLLKRSLIILGLTIIGFMVHGMLGLQSATISMTGAVMAIIVCRIDAEEAVKSIDVNTLLFFMGLFILVGGLEEAGVIEKLAQKSIDVVDGDVNAMTFLVLGLSGIVSAFVDNIPFTATMIPLIQDMQNILGIQVDYLWWSLSLGACFGGNGTMIGASPNVIILAEAGKQGYTTSFVDYFKICFPLMLVSLAVSGVYLYLRYLG
ncbi:MAG: SLC13 family permease [Succiniclasticum sp.]